MEKDHKAGTDSTTAEKLREAADLVNGAMTWSETKEGSDFWNRMHNTLLQKASAVDGNKFEEVFTMVPIYQKALRGSGTVYEIQAEEALSSERLELDNLLGI